jgi:peptidoglycan/xylan/chitin deacetylase (PgdA/CDA1 family)
VGVGTFERQIDLLAARFRVVPLRDLPLTPQDPADPVASVTFDDGYLDNVLLSLPVLERRGVRATFFLVPSLLGRTLRTRHGEEPLMTPTQARELVERGHEVGSHGLSHARVAGLPRDRAWQEIADSRRALEDLVQAPVTSFAYPFGRHDAAAREMVREAGYDRAVTTGDAVVPASPDPYSLPRLSVGRDVGMVQFRGKLTPAVHVYERLVRRRPPAGAGRAEGR